MDNNQIMAINTPLGTIFAKQIPDEEYPGIELAFSDNKCSGGPGVILEYNPLKKGIVLRVYGPNDPDGDPISVIRIDKADAA